MSTPPKSLILPQQHNTQPRLRTPHHITTLLVHRAPQLIPDPDLNLLLGHHTIERTIESAHPEEEEEINRISP